MSPLGRSCSFAELGKRVATWRAADSVDPVAQKEEDVWGQQKEEGVRDEEWRAKIEGLLVAYLLQLHPGKRIPV